ncbi:MAG: SDR family NAD(P)-dependent oxidoreductase [Vicinamibacterales bacterium]
MARALFESSPVVRDVLERADAVLGPAPDGRRLLTTLYAPDGDVHDIAWTQPALFAVEMALTELWRSWGIQPAAVMGHSVGEYAAACAAGVFSFEDGLRLMAERGRLMASFPAGAMAAVYAPVAEVEPLVAPMRDRAAIAAVNAPDSVVVSGTADAVDAVLEQLAAQQIQGQRLYVSVAAHSPLVRSGLDAMERLARGVTMRPPTIPVAWNLGDRDRLAGPDAGYWRRHMEEPVQFANGIANLFSDGYRVFVEVGPHPTLLALAQRSIPEGAGVFVSSLRRTAADWPELMGAAAELWVHGCPVNWDAVTRPYGPRRVAMPGYPFQRQSYWIQAAREVRPHARPASSGASALAGQRLDTAVPIVESVLGPDSPAYLADHRVGGRIVAAGPVLLEMIQSAAMQVTSARTPHAVDAFALQQPLVVPDGGVRVQVHLTPSEGGDWAVAVHSSDMAGPGEWRRHATARLVASAPDSHRPAAAPDSPPPVGGLESPVGFYTRLSQRTLELGGAFRSFEGFAEGSGSAWARVRVPGHGRPLRHVWFHPAAIDGALQAVGARLPDDADAPPWQLASIDRVDVPGPVPDAFWCHVSLDTMQASSEQRASVRLVADDGRTLGWLDGVAVRRQQPERTIGVPPDTYEVAWIPAPIRASAAESLLAPAAIEAELRERFEALATAHDLGQYDARLAHLDRLSAAYILRALDELGVRCTPGDVIEIEREAAAAGVLPQRQRLFGRLFEILAERGACRRSDRGWEVLAAAAGVEAREVSAAGGLEMSGPELALLTRCGPRLAGVLTGSVNPLDLLFPGGSFQEARALYVESPVARAYNGALADALSMARRGVAPDAVLRVLEVGAGTGGTTEFVLPQLPPDRTEYTFTDVSSAFLERARERYRSSPFVTTRLLDIERDPIDQGFVHGEYDVVVIANALHATDDLRRALTHVAALLAPGGMVLMLEGVRPEPWVDLTFGLTDGWWRFSDLDERPSYPLIEAAHWRRLLLETGFEHVVTLPTGAAQRAARQQSLLVATRAAAAGRWLLVGGPDGLSRELASRLRARGEDVDRCAVDDVRPAAAGEHVVYLAALDLQDGRASEASEACTRLAGTALLPWCARVLSAATHGRLWLATRGAQPAASDVSADGRWQAPLWGWGRVFALEQPHRWGGLVDLPSDADATELAGLLEASLFARDAEDQSAWRGGTRLVPRLTVAPPSEAAHVRFRPDAMYLITGGYGGLAPDVAAWLAAHGARHIGLVGRTMRPVEWASALAATGVRIRTFEADVADAASMTSLLASARDEGAPVRGVFHLAAALTARPLADLTARDVEAMFRPKVAGTAVLSRLAHDAGFDFLALFSSTTALLGAAGLAHYAAANQFLDAMAARPAGGPLTISVDWGTWDTMRLATRESQETFLQSGLLPMSAAEALERLGRLMGASRTSACVAAIDWSVLRPLHESRRPRPFLGRMDTAAARTATAEDHAPDLVQRLRDRAPSQRSDALVEFVQHEVAAVLGWEAPGTVPVRTGLFDLGMDSLMSVELKRRLERGAGRPLPSTLTFNYPNVAALAEHLEVRLRDDVRAASETPSAGGADAPPSLEHLSEDELEARLLEQLEDLR